MYSDIELDADCMEGELDAAMEALLGFVKQHLAQTGRGNFDGEQAEFVFNRDMMMNEKEVIDCCKASLDIVSKETIVSMHPWVKDKEAEMARLAKQEEENMAAFGAGFGGGAHSHEGNQE
jgi:hypothetical protein